MFLVPLVIFLGVKFGFRKSCQCKRNDKYEVWVDTVDKMDIKDMVNMKDITDIIRYD